MNNQCRFIVSLIVSIVLLIILITNTGQSAFQVSYPLNVNAIEIEKLTQKALQDGTVRVIVSLNVPFQPEGEIASPNEVSNQRLSIQQAQRNLLARLDERQLSSVKFYQYQPALAMTITPQELAKLEAAPEVKAIRQDKLSKPTLSESVSLIGARPDQTYGFTGADWTVAILDTGVDKTHSLISNKVVSEACYSTNNSYVGSSSVCPESLEQSTAPGSGMNCSFGADCNHGTHVAGIASGKTSGRYGVAQDATIISIQVFSRFDSSTYCGDTIPCALSWESDQILGLERVYQLASIYNIAAVNMSLGGGYYTSPETCDNDSPEMKTAIDNLRSIQVATVISSGNEGYTNGLSSPGCISSAISVGSTRDGSSGATPVNSVSSFSNSAPFLTLLAPGEWINSSIPGNQYQNYSGTSMAAPHVTGALAILKSSNSAATVDQMLSALINTGLMVKDTRNNISKPRILISGAIEQIATDVPSITSFSPTSAAIGKSVVLSGRNFTDVKSVKFNGVEADFKINSSTQITAIVPDGASSGFIIVNTLTRTARSANTFSILSVNESYTLIDVNLMEVEKSAVAWGDYDQDGDLDILLAGLDNNIPTSKVYRNDGQNVFEDLHLDLPGIYNGVTIWEDYDRDGDLDILLSGKSAQSAVTDIYQNDGNGNFSAKNAGLKPLSSSAAAWGDYDNDGDLDLLTIGLEGLTPRTILYSNDQGVFNIATTSFQPLSQGSVEWGDYDNDTDLDLLITGYDGTTAYTKIYRNNGDLTFTEPTHIINGVYGGNAVWSDYDNDGDLDILITGRINSSILTSVYRNMGASGFSGIYTDFADYDESMGAWVDFDNDGDWDFSVAGSTANPSISLYRNLSSPSVTTNIIGMYGGATAWGDYDQDSDLDLLITGTSAIGPATLLYRNEVINKNIPPEAPTNLSTTVQAGGAATMMWTAAVDEKTVASGLTYNLRVGTVSGGFNIIAPDSDPITGERHLPYFGNAWSGTTASLKNLPPGDYYWSVQAIDSAMMGSPFSQESMFTLLPEIRFAQRSYAVGEEQASLTFNITLSGTVQEQVVVGYSTANQTGIAGNDYIPTSGQLVFAPGQTTQTIQVEIVEDWMSEADETFTITLSNPSSNASLGNPKEAKVTILDNDGFADAGITLMTQTGYAYEGISRAWGDFDNDGDLDLVSLGTNDIHHTSATFTTFHRNNGDGTFTSIGQAGLTAVEGGYLDWGDFDNDGDLDVLMLGTSSGSWVQHARIYRNNGNVTFTDINAGLVGCSSASSAWGDYDNDGDLDVVINGHLGNGGSPTTRLYRNNGNATFTDMALPLRNLTKGQLAWGDYDGDNDLDLLITGITSTLTSGHPVTVLERNNGNGTFTEINSGLDNVAFGTAAWGDYDSDGDLDILLTGCTDGACASSISKVYRNNGNGSFTNINANLPASIWNKYSASADADRRLSSWGDYDNDGDLDILLSGIPTVPITRIYRNDGGGIFADTQDLITEGGSGPTAWGDFDNDGDLDLVTTTGRIYRNKMLSKNSVPDAPTGLTSSITGDMVTLHWSAAKDDQTLSPALTYNLMVGTYSHGDNVLSPMANKITGYRLIPAFGNANHGTSAILKNLFPGTTYYWSVQAVDTAFAGSAFSTEGTFTTPGSTISLSASILNIAEDQAVATILVSLSTPSQKPITVEYQTRNGTAVADRDYLPISGTLTFNPGQTVRTISVSPVEDNLDEEIETFNLVFSNPTNAIIGTVDTAAVNIQDNDSEPVVSFEKSVYDVNESQGSVAVVVNLSSASGKVITVKFATSDGTATAKLDYDPIMTTITFQPGETTKTVDVPVFHDYPDEPDETIFLLLSDPMNASLNSQGNSIVIIQSVKSELEFSSYLPSIMK